jgi:periplasmic divalent cation tolerance protein
MTAYVTVTTTTDNLPEAYRLAEAAVTGRAAACAQVSPPVVSTYSSKGRIRTTTEYRVEFKTSVDLADRLTNLLTKNHSSDRPEVVVTPIIGGNPTYLRWIGSELRSS